MPTPPAPARRKRPLVLVVEDDSAVRQPLEKFLKLHGFDVVGADTADEALDALSTKHIDAAVVDRGRRRIGPRRVADPLPAPVIFGGAGESDGLERLRPGTRLTSKPFSLIMLVEMLRDAFG
jgi:DNA-binding response OmpR family regulator